MQGLEYPADSPLELDMVPAEPEAEVQQQQQEQQQQQQQVSLICCLECFKQCFSVFGSGSGRIRIIWLDLEYIFF